MATGPPRSISPTSSIGRWPCTPAAGSCLRRGTTTPVGLDAYQVDGANGALTFIASTTMASPSRAVVVDPSGKYVYAANVNSASVSAFAVNETSGTLTPLAGSPVATVSSPQALAIDPSGRYLYVASNSGPLAGYAIDSATGALTAVAGRRLPSPAA